MKSFNIGSGFKVTQQMSGLEIVCYTQTRDNNKKDRKKLILDSRYFGIELNFIIARFSRLLLKKFKVFASF